MRRISRLFVILFMIGGRWGYSLEKNPIEFSLKASEEIMSVHVVGDFNNWSKTAHPLIYNSEDDIWRTVIELDSGAYEYRLLINGLNYIKDPANQHWRGGYSNSVKYVLTPQQPLLKSLTPGPGTIIRGKSFWIKAEYWSGVEKYAIDPLASGMFIGDIQLKMEYLAEKQLIRAQTPELTNGEYLIRLQAVDVAGNRALPESCLVIVNAENQPPKVEAGHTIIAGVGEQVMLHTGLCYDPDLDPIQKYQWRIISKPEMSKIKLTDNDRFFPAFKPDQIGRYVFGVKVSDDFSSSAEDSVDVYAFTRRKYPSAFQLADSTFKRIFETPIDSVYVAGEFNRWSTTENRLYDYDHDGVWNGWVDLEPGEYEYKFFVNNRHWLPDPHNPLRISDGWNGYNSIKKVTLNLAPAIAVNPHFQPGTILFDASKTTSKTGKKISFFWYQDINNPERFELLGKESLKIPLPKTDGGYYYYLVASDSLGSSAKKTIVLKVNDRQVQIQDFSATPEWSDDAIIYEIYVKQFTPQGTLQGVIEKIPYLKTLGVNCIWLMPIFESPTEDGYGPTNFFRIAPQLGTDEDLRELIAKAHEAGIKVMLDFIANHTSDQHQYFISAFRDRYSAFRDWFGWYDVADNSNFYSYKFHNDWDRLPNLNYSNPQVRSYILEVARYWANFGVDGFRCDVAWGVPHDFWKLFRREIKKTHPDFLILNETLPRTPAYHDDEFDMSYDTDFYGNLLDVMSGRKPLSAIEYGLNKTKRNYPASAQNLRYLENHDMDRFISQFSISKTKLAATLLFTIPGTPLLLYGQEFGLREKLPLMDWARIGDGMFAFYNKLIKLRRYHSCFRRGKMIKVPTNHEELVYAYLRRDASNTFLVVLNLSPEPLECQLLSDDFMKSITSQPYFEEVLKNDRIVIRKMDAKKIKLTLEPETSYIYQLK